MNRLIYALFSAFLLAGCSETENQRLTREAEELCYCHGGIDVYTHDNISYYLKCNDESILMGDNLVGDMHFYTGCKK